MIKALIFDFDGLILDTETPEYETWQAIYRDHGHEFPLQHWGKIIGGDGTHQFDPYEYLQELHGDPIDRDAIRKKQREEDDRKLEAQPILPGVEMMLDEAERMGLKLAVASSSPHSWVDSHLERLGLFDRFPIIVCADEVPRAKPDPALFLRALDELEVGADEAIVFEDSPNGVKAAKRAGIFCVAVPNPITRSLEFPPTDLLLDSLADIKLEQLLSHIPH